MGDLSVPVKSVQKAMALLDRIVLEDVEGRGVALSELAQHVGMPSNTAHNLLKSLIACGYVAPGGRGVYVAGAKCRQIGLLARFAEPQARQRLLGELLRFAQAEGEACVCSILVNGARVTVGSVDSTHAIQVAQTTIETAHFFARATGRILAAIADDEELREIIERHGMPGENWDGIVEEQSLRQALALVRDEGFCMLRDSDLIAFACPVYRANGSVWGALGAYAPAYRCPEERQGQLREALLSTAARIPEVIE